MDEATKPPEAETPITSLAEYLKARGLSQEAFGQLIGKSTPTVNRLVHGTGNPDLATLETIERVTGGQVTRAMFGITRPSEAA